VIEVTTRAIAWTEAAYARLAGGDSGDHGYGDYGDGSVRAAFFEPNGGALLAPVLQGTSGWGHNRYRPEAHDDLRCGSGTRNYGHGSPQGDGLPAMSHAYGDVLLTPVWYGYGSGRGTPVVEPEVLE
jgi:hypothetical protein